mmetsp:Transcript_10768/g.30845  ORF Transcript_10768/g.30845 Transcript_10768/m.30845 type:complete len:312 (+) Transcript_10768:1375-2310(+)
MGKVLNRSVSAIEALLVHHSVMDALAVASLGATKVMRHRVNAQESNERVQFSNPILQWRSRQAPTIDRSQRECRRGRLARSGFDHVSFVQNDSPPAKRVQRTCARSCHGFFHKSIEVDTFQRINIASIVVVIVVGTIRIRALVRQRWLFPLRCLLLRWLCCGLLLRTLLFTLCCVFFVLLGRLGLCILCSHQRQLLLLLGSFQCQVVLVIGVGIRIRTVAIITIVVVIIIVVTCFLLGAAFCSHGLAVGSGLLFDHDRSITVIIVAVVSGRVILAGFYFRHDASFIVALFRHGVVLLLERGAHAFGGCSCG